MGERPQNEKAEVTLVECYYCKGSMIREKSPYSVSRDGYHLVIDDVLAWVCKQCGEVYYENKEVDAIQEVVKAVDSTLGKVQLARAQ